MRYPWAALLAATSLAGQSSTQTTLLDPPSGSEAVFLVTLGLRDNQPTSWDGSVEVEAGNLLALIGREFRVGDVAHPPNRWEASSRPGFLMAAMMSWYS